MNELVTIIIPTYKGENSVADAVRSVLNQTYRNIEVIVVDDNGIGSDHQKKTEKSLKCFYSDSRFQYIPHEVNKNGSCARNTGIRNSHGLFIGFLDDDDVFLPEKTEKQMILFSELDDSYGLVYGSFREIIDSNHSRVVKAEPTDDFLYEFLCDRIIACSSTVIIRKEVLNSVIEWDESFKRHQDLEFFARVAFNYKVAFVTDICVEKHKLDRNTPKGEIYEEYHLHYINKMKPIIDTFSEEKQKSFYDHHYFEIGKAYIKDHNIKKAVYWAKHSSKPFRLIAKYGISTIKYVISKL